MNNKPEIGTIVTFNSSFGSETGRVVGYATLDPDTLQIESNGDIFAKHYSDVTVVVETPAAQDSEYQPAVGDVVEFLKLDDVATGTIEEIKPSVYGNIHIRSNGKIYQRTIFDIRLVERPTSAPVAITDDSAVDNTPSEQQSNDGQPSASEPVLSVAAYDALLYIYNVERGLISVHACDSLTRAGLITPICMQGSQWLVKANDAGREYVEKYLLAKEAQPVSGWVADALQSVNVEREAAVNDDYLPPTIEDNDDLPFSDLGEDEPDGSRWCEKCSGTGNAIDPYDGFTKHCPQCDGYGFYTPQPDKDETIASLEADLKAYHSLFSELWDTVQLADASEFVDEIEAILKSFERAQIMRKAGK